MTEFYGDFTCVEDICEEFEISPESLEGYNIIFAGYELASYDGRALVLLEKDGELFEVYGAHCSCHGLEEDWRPQKTTKEELKENLNTYYSYFKDFLTRYLDTQNL